jgi:outer membrane receptor protein involved in Fe transport
MISLLWAGLAAALATPSALAQSAAATGAATADADAAAATAPPGQTTENQAPNALQEVVVTGSNIERSGFEAPTPLTVVGLQDINRQAAINIVDTVNQLPQLGFGNNPHNSTDSVSDGNAGVSNLALLSLGANRTLVLLDGVRIAPASISGFYHNGGAVDVNAFPDALIQRVDVVTGGASAAYGSDAIAGVINFILNKTFTGLQINAEGGVTTYGDDRQYKGTITWGSGFADNRGHVLLAGGGDFTSGIPNGGRARPWINEGWGTVSNYANNGKPFFNVYNHVGNSLYSPGGLINSGPLAGTDFGPGGVPRSFVYGNPNDGYDMYGGNWQETLGVENQQVDSSLDNRLSRQNLFGRLSYDITDNFHVFGQIDVANTHALTNCCGTTASFTINSGNPFIPPSVQTQMNTLGLASFDMSQYISGNGQSGIAQADTNRGFTQYLVGANGKFPAFGSQWTWDAYATRSETILDAHTPNNLNLANVQLAANVVTDPATGRPICASTLVNPNDGCQPYNPMGIGVNSAAAISYIDGSGFLHQNIVESVVSATLHGEPFSDWAGPVSFALGVLHRNDSVDGRSDPIDESTGWWVGNYHPTIGSVRVTEGYLETVVPLLKDLPGAKQLDFNGAVRETGYSTSGTVTTWKLGLEWSPYSDLRFRATRSRDIRAPNLGEYFSKGSSGTGTVSDPFLGGAVVPNIEVTVGNQNLQPEKADETTAGIVFQPSWFQGFSISFDWYKIDIKGAIATASAQTEINECFAGNAIFCSLIDFNSNPIHIRLSPANTASLRTQGFDIEASYTKHLADLVSNWQGALNVRLLATHIGELTTVDPAGNVILGAGELTDANYPELWAPTWKYNGVVSYDVDTFSASFTGRGFTSGVQNANWIQCTSGCPAVTGVAYTISDNHLPGAFYMDLAFTYHLKREASSATDLYFTIDNVANNNPNFLLYGAGLIPTAYDYLGRMFRMGVRFKM